MQFTVPRLIKDKHQHFSILFYAQGKRYRVSNGKKFGVELHPNKEPFERRLIVAQELHEPQWGNFSEDMTFISLSGQRIKSGRNRIVLVPTQGSN